jgi:hypothetical protein
LLIKIVDGFGFLIAASDLSEFAGPKRPGTVAIYPEPQYYRCAAAISRHAVFGGMFIYLRA